MACTCDVGPGKFEGEPVATFLAWEQVGNGCADEDIGRYSFIRFPLDPDDDAKQLARDYGYCDECIASVGADDAYGVALWESDQGFVNGEWLATEAEWDKARKEAEAEADGEADDDGD